MNKKSEKKKLLIDRQSLRILNASTLAVARGAGGGPEDGTSVASALVCTNLCSSQECVDKAKSWFYICTIR
jgi:hypothetical protein